MAMDADEIAVLVAGFPVDRNGVFAQINRFR